MKDKRLIPLASALFACVSIGAALISLAQVQAAGDLLGPAPLIDRPAIEEKRPEEPAEQVKADHGPAAAPRDFTDKDLELYKKMGHKSAKWDQFVIPGFESFDAGSISTAGILFGRAYEAGCRDPLAIFRLAIYRESRGANKEAGRMFEEVQSGLAKRYPGHPLITALPRHIGRALYKADDYAAALPWLERALAVEPSDFMLLFMAGQIQRMQGKPAEARTSFERALSASIPGGISPDPEITLLRELVAITWQLKDFEACERYVDLLRAKSPADPAVQEFSRQLSRARQREKELEIIKKLID